MTATKDKALCPRCGQEVPVVRYDGASTALHTSIYKLKLHFDGPERCTGGDNERVEPSPGATIKRLPRT